MSLIVQRWIICAYEQVPHTDMDVFFVRTQEFLIMILIGIIQLAIDLGVSAHVRKKT